MKLVPVLQRSVFLRSINGGKLTCNTFRTYKTVSKDVARLNQDDIGSLYLVGEHEFEALNFKNNLPKNFAKQANTLKECMWLCRKPFLEIRNCLEAASVDKPSLRLVLWGKYGTGKTLTLCQCLHYAYMEKWVIFHVRSAMYLTRCADEIQMSLYRDGRINCQSHAVQLLENFKMNNKNLWNELSELKTQKNYEWTKVEKTSVGRPLTDIVEMGLSAPFAASDCVGALLKELKNYSSRSMIKLLVTIDKANSLYGKTLVKRVDRSFAPPDALTLVHHLRKLFQKDWTNGACVLVADQSELTSARDKETIPLITPLELFGDEGFEAIDPFIAIETSSYLEKEVSNLYDYYKEKMWIASEAGRTDRARKELMYLSAFNPHNFERLCAFT